MRKNTGIGFPNSVKYKNIIIVSDDEYVMQSLNALCNSTKGELLGDPTFGTNTLLFLFETNVSALIDMVADDLLEAISTYLPQLQVTRNDITGERDEDTVKIKVKYSYSNSNKTSTVYINLQGGE